MDKTTISKLIFENDQILFIQKYHSNIINIQSLKQIDVKERAVRVSVVGGGNGVEGLCHVESPGGKNFVTLAVTRPSVNLKNKK